MPVRALDHARELISLPSVSRDSNAEASAYIADAVTSMGLDVERFTYADPAGVEKTNVVARRGSGPGGIAFLAHSDTVPVEGWQMGEPFKPQIQDGKLYGRGACDMKGPVACMLEAIATADVPNDFPVHLIVTADEEVGHWGAWDLARRELVVEPLRSCVGIVGEPTRLEVVHAHKGNVLMRIISHGEAAHSSTGKGLNANLAMIPFLAEMKELHDDLQTKPEYRDDDFEPPTPGFNLGIGDHNSAANITARRSVCTLYYRPTPRNDAGELIEHVKARATHHGLEFVLVYAGEPMFTDPGSPWVRDVLTHANRPASTTVSYATDGTIFGQFLPLVVCGPGDIAQAHTVDEWIALEQLDQGTALYCELIEHRYQTTTENGS
ncbi:Acetylornithine deacetylase [Planctomycetes bacterium Pan216]|uniref:Acetylornithine deacetylase n=1 Tax=Kolteria novifilia TaxID=2527975 RepID=A0A518AY96_9BACT|nr:Acetylornithine deacetylase [Planctomycetes bacterium Pan216]